MKVSQNVYCAISERMRDECICAIQRAFERGGKGPSEETLFGECVTEIDNISICRRSADQHEGEVELLATAMFDAWDSGLMKFRPGLPVFMKLARVAIEWTHKPLTTPRAER